MFRLVWLLTLPGVVTNAYAQQSIRQTPEVIETTAYHAYVVGDGTIDGANKVIRIGPDRCSMKLAGEDENRWTKEHPNSLRLTGIKEQKKRVNRELIVPRGQFTFDAEGQEGGRFHSRKPHVPSEKSGLTIGRGYDMKEKTKKQIEDDLVAAGLAESMAKRYSHAAGLTGPRAQKFLDDHSTSNLLRAARDKGLQETKVNEYIRDNMLDEITLDQQNKLFKATYSRFEDGVKNKLPDYEKYPKAAQEAITDMAYNLGIDGLFSRFPEFVKAVQKQDWKSAAMESKRMGIDDDRNDQTRWLLFDAAKDNK